MDKITFYASGKPAGQPRPRAFSIRQKAGKALIRMYDPHTADGWRAAVAAAARPHIPTTPICEPVTVRLAFWFERPLSHSTKKGVRQNAPHWHTQKPDADNLAKAVLDELTNRGLWKDDTQVASLVVTKRWGQLPGCAVEVDILATQGNTEGLGG